jgi:ABC-type glycerol-3-phosphate transport system substrate-binding protein
MSKFKIMSLWVLSTIILTLFIACGGSGNDKTTVTILTWETPATNAAIDNALKAFTKDNPDITIQRLDSPASNYGDKLSSLALARKLPDLFWCGNDTEQQYTNQGLLYDYSAKLKAATSGNFVASNFIPVALQNWTTKSGKIGGLPSLMNTYGVWYNVDDFKAAGLALPQTGWTWDDMYHDAQALTTTSGGAQNYGLVAAQMGKSSDGPFVLSLYSLSAGGQAYTDSINNPTKVTIDPKYTEGVGKLAQAVQAGYVSPPGYDDTNTASSFSSGKVPMYMAGQWIAAGFLQNPPKVPYGFAPLPIATGGQKATAYDAVGICTPTYTKHADATWKVMQYLDTTAWEQVLKNSPVAAPAYQPSAIPYYNALNIANMSTVVETVKEELQIQTVNGVRFTTTWSSKAQDIETAYWPDILNGKKPLSELQTMANKLNDLIKSGG